VTDEEMTVAPANIPDPVYVDDSPDEPPPPDEVQAPLPTPKDDNVEA
jgi:hypothetical protein